MIEKLVIYQEKNQLVILLGCGNTSNLYFECFSVFLKIFCNKHVLIYKQIIGHNTLQHMFTLIEWVGERVSKNIVIYRILMQMGNKHIKMIPLRRN